MHQARVATRRLRSDLRTFGPLLDPAWVDTVARRVALARRRARRRARGRGSPRTSARPRARRRRRASSATREPLLAAAVEQHDAAQLRVLAALAHVPVPRPRRPARAGRDRAAACGRAAAHGDDARRRPPRAAAMEAAGTRVRSARPRAVRPGAARAAHPRQAGPLRGRGRRRRRRRRDAPQVRRRAHRSAGRARRPSGRGRRPSLAARARRPAQRHPASMRDAGGVRHRGLLPRRRAGGEDGAARSVAPREPAAASGRSCERSETCDRGSRAAGGRGDETGRGQRDRGPARAPPEVRRLDLPEGQARAGRDRRRGRDPRGCARRPASSARSATSSRRCATSTARGAPSRCVTGS